MRSESETSSRTTASRRSSRLRSSTTSVNSDARPRTPTRSRRPKPPIVNRPGTLDKRVRFALRAAGMFRHKLGYRRRPPIATTTFYALSDAAFEIQNIILQSISAQMRINDMRKINLDNALRFFELAGSHQNIVDQAAILARETTARNSRRARMSRGLNRSTSVLSVASQPDYTSSSTSFSGTPRSRQSKVAVSDYFKSKPASFQNGSSRGSSRVMKAVFRAPEKTSTGSHIIGGRPVNSPNLSRQLSTLSKHRKVSEVKYSENPRFVRSQRPPSQNNRSAVSQTNNQRSRQGSSTGSFEPRNTGPSRASMRSRQASIPMVRSPQTAPNSPSDVSLSPLRLDSSNIKPSQHFKIQNPRSYMNMNKFTRVPPTSQTSSLREGSTMSQAYSASSLRDSQVPSASRLSQDARAASRTSMRSQSQSQMEKTDSRKASNSTLRSNH